MPVLFFLVTYMSSCSYVISICMQKWNTVWLNFVHSSSGSTLFFLLMSVACVFGCFLYVILVWSSAASTPPTESMPGRVPASASAPRPASRTPVAHPDNEDGAKPSEAPAPASAAVQQKDDKDREESDFAMRAKRNWNTQLGAAHRGELEKSKEHEQTGQTQQQNPQDGSGRESKETVSEKEFARVTQPRSSHSLLATLLDAPSGARTKADREKLNARRRERVKEVAFLLRISLLCISRSFVPPPLLLT